jgi:kynureninase
MTEELALLDKHDPLAPKQALFHCPENLIYLDGNSLGLMPYAAKQRIQEVTQEQWGNDLITSWNKHQWIDLPTTIGERIAPLIGAGQQQVVCCDSISINLFKVISSAIKLRPGRQEILSTHDNFPTDLYMVQGLQALLGEQHCTLRMVDEEQLASSIDEHTAAVLVTEVNFRTGRRLDIAAITAQAHRQGALCIVDLAHSAGVLPVQLDNWQVDFAVGCTYKYLNGGPGAPAFVYAAKRHQEEMCQPLFGWMGHKQGFAFAPGYEPANNARQLLTGTPSIISMSAVDAALDAYDNVNIDDVREKSKQMTSIFLKLIQQSRFCQELHCISPEDPELRGSQLSFEYEHAYSLCQALIDRGVIADFRAPNYIRFGFAPLYNSFQQIANAVRIMESVLAESIHLQSRYTVRKAVT